MRNETRQLFNQYLERIASLNGIDSSAQKFAAAPAVEQKLEDRLQDSSAFLQRINFVPVDNQQGEKIGIEISGTIARTVDTSSSGERNPADPTDLDDIGYICTQTNYDTALRYAKLDAWRHHPNFQARLRDAILKRQALDRLLIGFNGISRAATSADHAKLSDVNKGWLQKLREHDSGSQVLDQSGDTPGVASYGEAGDYANLDALVYDATQTYIDPQYRDSVELVTIVGRSIMHDKLFPLVNQDNAPTETQAADILLGSKRLGGLQAMRASGFPDNAILITPLSNLSIYWQRGSRRRHIHDNPKKDRIENYESVNEAYVVEDYKAACLIENITRVDE